jgi:acetoacetyl-CoA synthetase
MRNPLWTPSKEWKDRANVTRFIDRVNRTYGLDISSYADLHKWSVEHIPDFWAAVWDFADIKASRKYDKVVEDLGKFPGARWFPGAKLNFAENLLRFRDDQPAFLFHGEDKKAGSFYAVFCPIDTLRLTHEAGT